MGYLKDMRVSSTAPRYDCEPSWEPVLGAYSQLRPGYAPVPTLTSRRTSGKSSRLRYHVSASFSLPYGSDRTGQERVWERSLPAVRLLVCRAWMCTLKRRWRRLTFRRCEEALALSLCAPCRVTTC